MNKLELRGALALICEICDNEMFDYELATGEWIMVVKADTIRDAIQRVKEEAGIDDKRRHD